MFFVAFRSIKKYIKVFSRLNQIENFQDLFLILFMMANYTTVQFFFF